MAQLMALTLLSTISTLQSRPLRTHITRAEVLAAPLALLSSRPACSTTIGDPIFAELSARLQDETPSQQQASLGDALGTPFGRSDNLIFPDWMEGEWTIRSNIRGVVAPLGRKYLPTDLQRVRLGAISEADGVPPLQYNVRFVRRTSDNSLVSDRENNLRSVQDASAGYARVQKVEFDGSTSLKVTYSPFGPNGTFPGESRAEVFIQRRRQSDRANADRFAFAESTRTVLLAQGRSVTISDAETLNVFHRRADGIDCRQRVLRFLTPNPNSAEGVLWQEARGRAVALLDYELRLSRQ